MLGMPLLLTVLATTDVQRGSELNVIECSLNILRTTGETRSDVLMKTKHDVKNLIQYPANVTVIYLKFQ